MNYRVVALALLLLFASGCMLQQAGPGNCPNGTVWNPTSECCQHDAAPFSCMDTGTATSLLLWQNWQGAALLLILTGFVLMGLTYMVAYGFGFKSVQIFVKNELFQLAMSALIIGNILFFTYLMEFYSQDFSANILALEAGGGTIARNGNGEWEVQNIGDGITTYVESTPGGVWDGRWNRVDMSAGDTITCASPCHIYLARAYLGANYERIQGIAREVIKIYATLSWVDYVRVGMFINILGVLFGIKITLMPFTGLSIIYHSLGTCFDFMAKAMVSLKFQEMALLYVQNGIFPLFLMAGIITRSVWFLRKLGGLLIAIAIGVYFLLPLLYVLCWYTVDSSTMTMQMNADMVPSGDIRTALLPWDAVNLGIDDDNVAAMLFTQYDANNIATPGILELTAGTMLPALAVPLLNMLITIAFIKTLSASLGGDIEIAGLTRIL